MVRIGLWNVVKAEIAGMAKYFLGMVMAMAPPASPVSVSVRADTAYCQKLSLTDDRYGVG